MLEYGLKLNYRKIDFNHLIDRFFILAVGGYVDLDDLEAVNRGK